MDQKAFNKLKLQKKYDLLQKEGEFIATRTFESYFVHLFSLHGTYVEAWYKIGLNHLYWIEICKNKDALSLYADNVDIHKNLGLDEA